MVLVILPVQTIRSPVASGSSVPACPIFIFLILSLLLSSHFILLTAWNDVQCSGLSINKTWPFKKSSGVCGVCCMGKFSFDEFTKKKWRHRRGEMFQRVTAHVLQCDVINELVIAFEKLRNR